MTKPALVTVMIPLYNKERYISDCLESVLTQTWKHIEIVVVDDESTDGSIDIVEKYTKLDERIILIKNSHGGPSKARNKGIEAAKGEYIIFLDADDLFEPEYIEKMVKGIAGADICLSGYKIWDQKNDMWNCCDCIPGSFNTKDFYAHQASYSKVLGYVAWKIYRTDLIRNNNIFFPLNIKVGEDTVFFFQALQYSAKITFIDDKGYIYRKHDQNALTVTTAEDIMTNEIFIRELQRLYDNNTESGIRCLIRHWQYINMFEIGIILSKQTERYSIKKKNFYDIANRNKINKEYLEDKPFSKREALVRFSLLTRLFFPLYFLIKTIGKIKHL